MDGLNPMEVGDLPTEAQMVLVTSPDPNIYHVRPAEFVDFHCSCTSPASEVWECSVDYSLCQSCVLCWSWTLKASTSRLLHNCPRALAGALEVSWVQASVHGRVELGRG